MDELLIEVATEDDLDLLTELNKQLNQDQQHDRILSEEQFRERMRTFLQAPEYKAYLFKHDGKIRGYALVNHESDPLYMRHFYICRDSRRSGYGRRFFEKLMKMLNAEQLDIQVLIWNERGRAFWEALGFKTRSLNMRWGD